MMISGDGVVEWDRGGPLGGEAVLLLEEQQHRVANEIASAIAAMRLAQNAGVSGPRVGLFDQAIERLEGFGKVHRVLAARPSRTIDVSSSLHQLCRGLVSGRGGLENTRVRLAVTPERLPGGPGHRLLLIAAELVFNGIRHALVGRGGSLEVRVDLVDDFVRLVVSDDGPGIRAASGTSGTGLGADIVSELVRRGNGRIECDSDGSGTVFRVSLPLDGRQPIDWLVPDLLA